MSIPIHWFIDPVDWSRSISTVDKDSPTWEYGRYRQSMPIHLRRITFDGRSSIKNRNNFVVDFIDDTCARFRTRFFVDWAIWFRQSKFFGAPEILHLNFVRGSKKHRSFARILHGGWMYEGWCLQFTVCKDELCRIIHELRLMREQFNKRRGVVPKSGHFMYRFQSTVLS